MNEYELSRLKLPLHLFLLLKPYLGCERNKALELDQVELSVSDAKILSEKVKDVTINKIVKRYEQDTQKKFRQLSKNLQTAIADYFYQYGPSSMEKPHHNKLWNFIIKGEWKQAAQFLQAESNYAGRRAVEAKLILESPELNQNTFGANKPFIVP
jgi:GH24 family phage-related lysozyme (muramidase)